MLAEIYGPDLVLLLVYLGSLVLVVWAVVDISTQPRWRMSRARKLAWLWPCILGWFFLGLVGGVVAAVYLRRVRRRLPLEPVT